MSSLTINSVEVFACKTDAPQITWAKDMTPMYESNIIVRAIIFGKTTISLNGKTGKETLLASVIVIPLF